MRREGSRRNRRKVRIGLDQTTNLELAFAINVWKTNTYENQPQESSARKTTEIVLSPEVVVFELAMSFIRR